jgi:hypothetical protein
MIEQWKDIPGYEGLYQVSNMGNVKSLNYNRSGREKLLNLNPNNQGYLNVGLSKNGKQRSIKIHRLVAIAFLDHQADGTMNVVVNHIDNNKSNNRVDNLELVSQRHNSSCHKKDVGITWDKARNKWLSSIHINKRVGLGRYTDKQEALDIYQKALANMHLYDGDAKAFKTLINQLGV